MANAEIYKSGNKYAVLGFSCYEITEAGEIFTIAKEEKKDFIRKNWQQMSYWETREIIVKLFQKTLDL